MPQPITMSYLYLSECGACSEEKIKNSIVLRDFVSKLFLCIEDENKEYTKIRYYDDDCRKGNIAVKTSKQSILNVELNENTLSVLITLSSSLHLLSNFIDKLIKTTFEPTCFNSDLIIRNTPHILVK